MDLHDWEFLDDDGFLDFHGDAPFPTSHPTTQFDMNYFTCPSPNSTKIVQPILDFPSPHQPAQFQLRLEKTNFIPPTPHHDDDDDNDLLVKEAVDSKMEPPAAMAAEADQDSVSQVFFTKTRENEFADMKLDSPKSEADERLDCPRLRMGPEKRRRIGDFQGQKEVIWEEDNGALKIWKWSLNGIGAICSFGMAAATICVIFFGSHHGHKHPQHTIHKRSKMNAAISGLRGGPMSRAQIRTGGRYDAI